MGAIAAYSVERTKLDGVPPQMCQPDELRGRVRIHKTSYVWTTGNIGAGSTITGALLPTGARIVGGHLYSDAMASGGTLVVTVNSVNLSGTITVSTSVSLTLLPVAASGLVVLGVDFGGFAPVITTGAADAVVGGKVVLHLYYVTD